MGIDTPIDTASHKLWATLENGWQRNRLIDRAGAIGFNLTPSAYQTITLQSLLPPTPPPDKSAISWTSSYFTPNREICIPIYSSLFTFRYTLDCNGL